MPPIWYGSKREPLMIICEFGNFTKIEARGGYGWSPTRDITNNSGKKPVPCTGFDLSP